MTAGSSALATYSNVNGGTGYVQRTLTVNGTGAVKITFTGVEGSKLATLFLLDDLSIKGA